MDIDEQADEETNRRHEVRAERRRTSGVEWQTSCSFDLVRTRAYSLAGQEQSKSTVSRAGVKLLAGKPLSAGTLLDRKNFAREYAVSRRVASQDERLRGGGLLSDSAEADLVERRTRTQRYRTPSASVSQATRPGRGRQQSNVPRSAALSWLGCRFRCIFDDERTEPRCDLQGGDRRDRSCRLECRASHFGGRDEPHVPPEPDRRHPRRTGTRTLSPRTAELATAVDPPPSARLRAGRQAAREQCDRRTRAEQELDPTRRRSCSRRWSRWGNLVPPHRRRRGRLHRVARLLSASRRHGRGPLDRTGRQARLCREKSRAGEPSSERTHDPALADSLLLVGRDVLRAPAHLRKTKVGRRSRQPLAPRFGCPHQSRDATAHIWVRSYLLSLPEIAYSTRRLTREPPRADRLRSGSRRGSP